MDRARHFLSDAYIDIIHYSLQCSLCSSDVRKRVTMSLDVRSCDHLIICMDDCRYDVFRSIFSQSAFTFRESD